MLFKGALWNLTLSIATCGWNITPHVTIVLISASARKDLMDEEWLPWLPCIISELICHAAVYMNFQPNLYWHGLFLSVAFTVQCLFCFHNVIMLTCRLQFKLCNNTVYCSKSQSFHYCSTHKCFLKLTYLNKDNCKPF